MDNENAEHRIRSYCSSFISHNINAPMQYHYSFEFFPPKTREGVENLILRIGRLAKLNPLFVDITWAAGGESKELSLEICKRALNNYGLTCQLHLTCTNMLKSDIKETLETAKELGIRNILALRGDPPKGNHTWSAVEDGFEHASDLVQFIREEYGDYFGISVAGFPEGHVESKSYDEEMKHLKAKVDAGADFIITQLFYDVEKFLGFVSSCRAMEITVPIIPGIMAIQNYRGFIRMTSYCKINVPPQILKDLEPIKHDDSAVKEYGIQLGIRMCQTLLDQNTPFIHFYTLNLERSVKHILRAVGFTSTVAARKLPWRPSAAPYRSEESVRPIYWSNRPESYLARTVSWDEFPNGRWGDSRSPAFGELGDGHFYSNDAGPLNLRRSMWGDNLRSLTDVYSVFADYIQGKVSKLPWCEQALDLETSEISNQLVRLNQSGFLTINSQPKVNGLSSSDSKFGWGGDGGYVYQKAYLEFFCSAKLLKKLMDVLSSSSSEYKSLIYHAVDSKGNSYRNSSSTSPAAVTWGVWPNKEVQQPTVVDYDSFVVWKDEAFKLWLDQWAVIYNEDTPSYNLIYDVYESFYLVNIVDNNYITGNIFNIFDEILREMDKNATDDDTANNDSVHS